MRSRTSTWFETKVKYQKTMEDGSEKVVSEAYVVDALSFTEAESAITDEMPLDVLRQRSHLLGEFLFVTLAEDTLSFSISLLDILVGMKLADGNETNTGRQAVQHLMEISFYIIVHILNVEC